jgi:D-inositol-3-phosphate glycosyltransferase
MSDRRTLAGTRHSDRRCEAPEGGAIKIAMFVSNYLPHPGGLEVMVWNLARGLARRHEVVLVTSAYNGVHGVSDEDGMTVHRLPAVHVTERFGVPYPVPAGPGLQAALRGVAGAQVVHAHGALYAQSILARALARRAGAPFVLTEHVGFVEYPSASLNAIQRVAWSVIGTPLVRGADAVVTYNARVHDELERRSGREVRFVGNGVDVEQFHPRTSDERRALRRSFGLPEKGVLALFAGRESEKKNLDVLLRAERDAYTLVVCGWERNLTGRALVDLGVVPYARMADLFACADVMLHPASGEGFPLAVQEAIASGLPVALLWDEGYSRWMPRTIVAACATAEEVPQRMAELARDSARRLVLGDAGRAWAKAQWSWDATVKAYERIYVDVADDALSS